MEKHHVMSHREKMVTSFAIWFGTFSMGVSSGFIGPSLIEFSRKFDTDVAAVSKVFSVHTVAFIIGAFSSGFVFNHVNRQLVSAILLVLMGIIVISLPLQPSLTLFFVVSFIQALCSAGYDTSQIVWMIELWEGDAAAFIQTQHFSYAAGAFFSPTIVKQFLPEDSTSVHIGSIPKSASLPITRSSSAPLFYVPFLIGGLITVMSGLFILVLYKIKKYEKPTGQHKSQDGFESNTKYYEENSSKSSHRKLLLLLSSMFIGFYGGMEGSAFHFLSAFAHFIDLHLSQRDAAGVICMFSGAFTLGRGLGIGIVLRIPSEILLTGNFLIILAGNCFLYFSNESSLALHAAALILGLGYSTVFAGYFGFIEKHVEVGNMEGAVLIAAGSSMTSFYPLVIGGLIEKLPFILLRVNMFSLCFGTLTFLLIWSIATKTKVTKLPHFEQNGECWVPIIDQRESD